MIRTIAFLTLILIPAVLLARPTNYSGPYSDAELRQAWCNWANQRIEWVDSEMRKGYRVRRGEWLKEERRFAEKVRWENCP